MSNVFSLSRFTAWPDLLGILADYSSDYACAQ
jgi:hypothetical protein